MWLLLFKVTCMFLLVECAEDTSDDSDDLGDRLAEKVKKGPYLDHSADEEYEDLRAEFLAYRSALDSLKSEGSRRALVNTPCWKRNGICVNYKLCNGFEFKTQVPGCKDKLMVCCFVWNKFVVKDMRGYAIGNPAMPWSLQREYGGQGIVLKTTTRRGRRNRTRNISRSNPAITLIIRSD